jgi:glutathione S-transferase
MHPHSWVAIVTLVSLLVYVWMALGVGGARKKSGIDAPTMTGDPELERHIRVQANTLEWLPIFLPSLWLFAIYWNDLIATILGVIWIFGRIIYALGYAAGPASARPASSSRPWRPRSCCSAPWDGSSGCWRSSAPDHRQPTLVGWRAEAFGLIL